MTKVGYKAMVALALAVFVTMSFAYAATGGEKGTNTVYINELPYCIDEPGKYLLNVSGYYYGYGPAITINSDDVILDGNGNCIEGCSYGYGKPMCAVWVKPCYSDITIKNLEIYDFEKGIFILEASNCMIMKNYLECDFEGIFALDSEELKIDCNELYNCAYGIHLACCTDSKIINNLVDGTCYAVKGIWLENSDDNKLAANEVYNNDIGILLDCLSTGNDLNGNKALENNWYDIVIENEDNSENGNQYDTMWP